MKKYEKNWWDNRINPKVGWRRGKFPLSVGLFLYEQQNGLCYYCGENLLVSIVSYWSVDIDHKQPVSKEGTNELDNLCITCLYCNRAKNNKTEEEFRKWIKPYINKTVLNKHDLKDWHKFKTLKKRFKQ